MLMCRKKVIEPITDMAKSIVALRGDSWVVVSGPHPLLCHGGKPAYLLQPPNGGAAVWVAESDDPDFRICQC